VVMREIAGSSVGPTASESILNARRANKDATRASTPDELSTKTAKVCFAMLIGPFIIPGNPSQAQFHAQP